jgi:hypothetical protein
MSIRIAIAKWLAPEVFDRNEVWREAIGRHVKLHDRHREERWALVIALRNIQALRTPSCAHIGKRMADIAEAALSPSREKAE